MLEKKAKGSVNDEEENILFGSGLGVGACQLSRQRRKFAADWQRKGSV